MSSNPSLATAAFRLSAQQERAWAQRQEPGVEIAQCVIAIAGRLDISGLEKAIREVVGRFEILRTQFRRRAGAKLPFQVIAEEADFHFASLTQESREIAGFVRSERESVSNIETEAPLRALLVSGGANHHSLILTLPAFSADRATLNNLSREIASAYRGKPAAEDPMQYADLVEWQNEMLASDETKPGRDFWREQCRRIDFAGLRNCALPLEKKSELPFSPQSLVVEVRELGGKIEAASEKLNLAPEEILLAAWSAFLSRLMGAREVTLGVEFDGRRYEELEAALGPLARTLPLPIELDSNTTFDAHLRHVRSLFSEARNWQESFSWTEVPGDDSPVLPFSFSFHDLGPSLDEGEVRFRLDGVEVITERTKLGLGGVRRTGATGTPGLELEFHYDANRLERPVVERIAGYYQNLLSAAITNPELPIARLPFLSESERHELLVEWNRTEAEYPATQCLHQLFEAQAERTPEREAIRSGERAYTYREANERSNQLAHYLRRQGVGPDSRVCLCVERTAESLIGVLAILKAGAAYVPLNADNPVARLKQQMDGATALITEKKFLPNFGEPADPEFSLPMMVLDRDEQLWASEPKTNPAVNTTPENLVYVIYTSGSTGVPKGVGVRHRNLVNYANFITRRLEVENYDGGLEFATVSTLGADLGNTCIYPALISGGCVHVVPFEMSTDARALAAYTAKHPIDVLKIVPSHLEALTQSEEAKKILPRRYLILGGETLTRKLVEKIEALNPSCEILNHYGPTETTVGSLTLKLAEYDWRKAGRAGIPIGKPIQNTQAYVLDLNLEPVPVGAVGELYIAGAGVTAGYLGQAEKTAERFLRDPFAADPDGKMYRTGDLARWGEDGNLEFLGRGDDQVKVRGFRIELGEIETVLGRHAGVKQALVVARSRSNSDDVVNDKRLVAYVVLDRDPGQASPGELTGEDLKKYLHEQVPDYMVPQAIVVLGKFPLNANGKIDRQALPEPEAAQAARAYLAPRSETERAIVEIWAEVLRRDEATISVEDNFFDLGGHSLLATQVISRIRKKLDLELPLRTLFESPVIAGLAEQADKAKAGTSQAEVPPLGKVSRDRPLPLSFAQQRLWVLDRIEPDNPLYNVPRAFRLRGNLNAPALTDSLNEIVRRHESQRTTFATDENGHPVQVIAESLRLEVPLIDLSLDSEAERESRTQELATLEAQTPFRLSRGPLLRAKILRLGGEDHVLLLTMHHIVSDAWSAGVFMEELGILYEAFSEGKPSPLAELPIQYGDYAVWQRNQLQGAFLKKQLDYWRNHLAGAPPVLRLPSDRPLPERRTFEGAYEKVPLSKEVREAVKRFSTSQGVTPFMTLLAAYNAVLGRHSGQDHIVLGTDIANRTTAETERLIGFFINLLPLHTDLSGDPSFTELVLRVREVALGAYAHQDIPFDKLVEDLQPERSRSHNPIVQSLFVMQNIPRQRRELRGLEVEPFPMPVTRSKFDIAVFIAETEDEIVGYWVYSTELFDSRTVLRMASHYENLLRSGLAQPDSRLSALRMLSEEELQLREQETAERKQSQRRKLMSAAPKPVALPGAPEKE